jgi:hypothetical protein
MSTSCQISKGILQNIPLTTKPVWEFVNETNPGVTVTSSREITAPIFSLKPKGPFFHDGSDVSLSLPHGISAEEREKSILSTIYGKKIYDENRLRHLAYSSTSGFLPNKAFEVAQSYVGGRSEIGGALTQWFGVFDTRAREVAHRLLDSSREDSPWSPANMIKSAGLEDTVANLAAARNYNVFNLPEKYQPLGIQVLAQQAEGTVRSTLPRLQDKFVGPIPQELINKRISSEALRDHPGTIEWLFHERIGGEDLRDEDLKWFGD